MDHFIDYREMYLGTRTVMPITEEELPSFQRYGNGDNDVELVGDSVGGDCLDAHPTSQ